MRKYVFVSVVLLLPTDSCYAQWTAQDSLKLKKLLEESETLQLNREAVRQIDFGSVYVGPRISEEKSWLRPDDSLPVVPSTGEQQVKLTLSPYTAQTRYDWDPIYRKKIRVTQDTWRGESWQHLDAGNRYAKNSINLGKGLTAKGLLLRGADFLSSPAAVHCHGAAGVGVGGVDLMAIFSKEFGDFKGRERRARTLQVLRSYETSMP